VKKYCVHDVTLAWAVVGREWTRRERTAARGDESVTTYRKMDATGRQRGGRRMSIMMRGSAIESHVEVEVGQMELIFNMFDSLAGSRGKTSKRQRRREGVLSMRNACQQRRSIQSTHHPTYYWCFRLSHSMHCSARTRTRSPPADSGKKMDAFLNDCLARKTHVRPPTVVQLRLRYP
jgi:hypothetical protein